MKKIIYLLILYLSATSCEKFLLQPDLKNDFRSVFLEYTQLVKEKYAMLDFKNIDIDYIRDSIYSTISDNTSNEELFKKLSYVTLKLKDGHSYLEGDGFLTYYKYSTEKSKLITFNRKNLMNNYWNTSSIHKIDFTNKNSIYYGTFSENNKDIGYIYIKSFDIDLEESQIENIFLKIKHTNALIIDIRNNSGGAPSVVSRIVSYLTSKKILVGVERFKVGPEKDDFSDSKIYAEPSGSVYTYEKPVYVLVNRGSFSASTTFMYLTAPIKNITSIGMTSGGGAGFSADGYLANGWKWSLSISEFIDLKGNHLDNGMSPDISETLSIEEILGKSNTDNIINRAIKEFRKTTLEDDN